MANAFTELSMLDPSEIVATFPDSLLVLSINLTVEYANQRFYDKFEVGIEDTIGMPLAELGNGQWNIPSLLEPLSRIIEENSTIEGHEVDHTFEQIGRRIMSINARKTIRPGNGSQRILLVIEDITSSALTKQEADRQKGLLQGIVDTLREPLLVLDGDLKVLSASRAFYSKFNADADSTLGSNLKELGNGQWDIPVLLDLLSDVIPDNESMDDFEVRHDFPEIGEKVILLSAHKIFRKDDNSRTFLLAMEDVTHARRVEAEREAALSQARALLEELNHRVMNSLTMIGSIIAIEGRSFADEKSSEAFERMQTRVYSVSALYRSLSRSSSVDHVEADIYLPAILNEIVSSVISDDWELDLDIDIVPALLPTEMAVPLGLIVNELATNSLKYAFEGRKMGQLGLHLRRADTAIELAIWDDGPGIDESARVDSGLGQRLIQVFAVQLNAELAQESGAGGTRYTLTVPFETAPV